MTDRRPIYKADQLRHMKDAAVALDEALDHLRESWMPYGWQEAARNLRGRITTELER